MLTKEQIERIKLDKNSGLSGYSIAKKYGISSSTVYAILNGKTHPGPKNKNKIHISLPEEIYKALKLESKQRSVPISRIIAEAFCSRMIFVGRRRE